jgi:uncharacterized membrane protein YhaH (DUF805 family)
MHAGVDSAGLDMKLTGIWLPVLGEGISITWSRFKDLGFAGKHCNLAVIEVCYNWCFS